MTELMMESQGHWSDEKPKVETAQTKEQRAEDK